MSRDKVDCKVVLLGKEFGGKTSLVERFLHDRFNGMPYQNTIGAAFGAKRLRVRNRWITLGIWDTAGSEKYQAMSRIYYRDAQAAIVCYDLTDDSSFKKVRFWVNELSEAEEHCKIYLCGTKLDLIETGEKQRAVDQHDCLDYGRTIDAQIFETSSKSGLNVSELFQRIADEYVPESTGHMNDPINSHGVDISIPEDAMTSNHGKCCS